MYNIYPAHFLTWFSIYTHFFLFYQSRIKHSFDFEHIYLRIRLIQAYDEL